MNASKYQKFETVKLTDRTWPDKEITKAPTWCSVDLRDGNQALITPMNIDQKVLLFKKLVEIGFKEIEVGFPSASSIEYDFLRKLIDDNLVPDDVTIQVLTQAREHLIRRTFESLKGLNKVVLHLYNSTSILQRNVVFHKSKEEIKQIAVDGVKLVKELSKEFSGKVVLEYSPESFTGTEMDYAIDVCEAVMDTWEASANNKVIINLPATVEMDSPNVYADQIEYVCRHFKDRSRVIVSLHPHNDRGCGVAASELGLMAGADRIEGTLFGNGERTGNVDIITVALNMLVHGVNPQLDFSNMNELKTLYEDVTKMVVHDRHPYAGKLVFTAFSGSHQDAINKGMHAYHDSKNKHWEIPYLPIDPDDLGRKYEPIVRINSQSGKGGIAFVLETTYGFRLPKYIQSDFSQIVQETTEKKGELLPAEIFDLFARTYINSTGNCELSEIDFKDDGVTKCCSLDVVVDGKCSVFYGEGLGPIDACVHAINASGRYSIDILNYDQHSLISGSDSKAVSYVEIIDKKTEQKFYGVGLDASIVNSTIKAVFTATNKIK